MTEKPNHGVKGTLRVESYPLTNEQRKTLSAPGVESIPGRDGVDVPLTPSDAAIIEQAKKLGLLADDGPKMTVPQWDALFALVRHFAAGVPGTFNEQGEQR